MSSWSSGRPSRCSKPLWAFWAPLCTPPLRVEKFSFLVFLPKFLLKPSFSFSNSSLSYFSSFLASVSSWLLNSLQCLTLVQAFGAFAAWGTSIQALRQTPQGSEVWMLLEKSGTLGTGSKHQGHAHQENLQKANHNLRWEEITSKNINIWQSLNFDGESLQQSLWPTPSDAPATLQPVRAGFKRDSQLSWKSIVENTTQSTSIWYTSTAFRLVLLLFTVHQPQTCSELSAL